MSLYTLLAFLGLSIFGARDYPVTIVDLPDLGGVACRADFREVPGNAQYLCPDGFEGIVLDPTAFSSPRVLANLLMHETRHLDHGADGPADDRFNERAAYAEACAAFPIPACEYWTTGRVK